MRIFKWTAAIVLVLVLGGGLVGYFYLDSLVKKVVEEKGTASLNLKTTLKSASISLFGGKVALNELGIGSPDGFSAPEMFALGKTEVHVSYGELRGDPMKIDSILLEKPHLVIELKGTTLNFKEAMDKMPRDQEKQGSPGDGKRDEGEPLRMIINKLEIKDAVVTLKGFPGIGDKDVAIPSLIMEKIGSGEGNQNGAALKQVVMDVISALAGKAMEQGNLGAAVNALLKGGIDGVVSNLTSEIGAGAAQQLNSVLKNPADALKNLSTGDPGMMMRNPGGGPTSKPSTPSLDDVKKKLPGL